MSSGPQFPLLSKWRRRHFCPLGGLALSSLGCQQPQPFPASPRSPPQQGVRGDEPPEEAARPQRWKVYLIRKVMRPEKWAFVLPPVTTRTNRQRQGLNLHSEGRRSEDTAGYVPSQPVTSYLKPTFFIQSRSGSLRGLEFRKKLIRQKWQSSNFSSILSSADW